MASSTAHQDTFVRDNLPPHDLWPEFCFDDLPELQFPQFLNATDELLDKHLADGHGDRVALIGNEQTWSYRELSEVVNRIAHVYVDDYGVVPGNRILLHGPNSPWLAACWLAALKVGAVVVTTMPLLRARDLVPVIEKGQVELAVCDSRVIDEVLNAKEQSQVLKKVLVFGTLDSPKDLQNLMVKRSADFPSVRTRSDDPAIIAFSSGTTGPPKGCVHFHRDVLAMGHCFSAQVLRPTADDVFIGSPPLAFTYGLGALLVFPMMAGASSVLLEKAAPADLGAAIQKHQATILFTSPTGYRAMMSEIGEHDLDSLRQCVSAGEHLSLKTFEEWEKATGIRLIDGIGATEMIHIFISASGNSIRPGSIGKVVPGYQACLLGDDNQPLPPGSTGKLAVKGPTGCRYLDDPRQGKYVMNGWNVTGDVFRQDEDGYFSFVSRDDDMIVSAGYNISGPEVEEALLEHPAVSECAVVAQPDPARGNIVKAFVVLTSGQVPSTALIGELQNFVKANIAPYKYPRAIEFIHEIPKTETGKYQRFRLRERAGVEE